MTALTARYDTRPPSKGPYSAIVYIDGSQVVAEDADGKVIASRVAGVDDSAVMAAVAAALPNGGSIFLKKSANAYTYVPTAKVVFKNDTFIYSDNAWIDARSINDTVFEMGADTDSDAERGYLAGLSGVHVLGCPTNNNTLLAKIINCSRGARVENISANKVSNVIKLRGCCYSSTIKNVLCQNDVANTGSFIALEATNVSEMFPTNIELDHCEITGWNSSNQIGINILASTAIVPQRPGVIIISNSYFEQIGQCVHSEGNTLTIENSRFSKYDGNCIELITKYINGVDISGSGDNNSIVNCSFYIPETAGGHSIYVDAGANNAISSRISNSYFYGGGSVNRPHIHNAGVYGMLLKLSDNEFSYTSNCIDGRVSYSTIIGNVFTSYLNAGTAIDLGTGSYDIIEGNAITNFALGINAAGAYYPKIFGNNIRACTTAISVANATGPQVDHNGGIVTEKSGSSTGTGAEQTIAHGLISTPSKVNIVPTQIGTILYGLWADVTNIYPTVTNGKTFIWSAEV